MEQAPLPLPNDPTNIAGINISISYIQRDISEIKDSLKVAYATKDSLAEVAKLTETRLTRLEKESNIWRFLSPTLSAIVSSAMTFFVIQYFTNLHK